MSHIFTEAKLEQAIIELLGQHANNAGKTCYPHYVGNTISRKDNSEVLIVDDLRQYLANQYQADGITESEITTIVLQLQSLPASDLYQSNKTFAIGSVMVLLKREDRKQKTCISNCSIPKHCLLNWLNYLLGKISPRRQIITAIG